MSDKLTVSDDAVGICKDVVARVFMPENSYNHSKVPTLVTQITNTVVQKMTQQAKLPRKYVVHCAIIQKNGAGVHAASACLWSPASDACYVHRAENNAMTCIITIYGVTM